MAHSDPGKDRIAKLVRQASVTGKLPDLPSRDREPLTYKQAVSNDSMHVWGRKGRCLTLDAFLLIDKVRTGKSFQGTCQTDTTTAAW
jgi:hypothetical protein